MLVLDDVQALHAPAADAALAALLARLPHEVTLAIASRTPPRLPVARMRAEGRVMELGPRELAMDAAEAAAMLVLAGAELGEDDVARLLDCTEGWPAALALAALGSPAGFGGTDRLVAEYVREELLRGLSPERRRFLLETSVLDTVTGPLCDRVLERDGAATALVELCREDGLLIALDRSDEYFRHHRLVAEMLRAELRRLEPSRAAELHRRARDWYRAAGDDDRAVRHAVAAGDVEAAGDLVWRSTWPALSRGDKQAAEAWVQLFSDAERVATPALALAAASTQLASGQGHLAEHWTHAAAAAPPSSPAVAAGIHSMRAALARDGIARMRADAEHARRLTPEGSPVLAIGCLLAGTAALLAGDDDATALLEEGAHRAAVSAPDVHALCLTQLALPALAREDWEEASAFVTRARAQLDAPRPRGLSRQRARPRGVGARARAPRPCRGGPARPRRRPRLREQLTDFAAWYEAELLIVLARVAVRLERRQRRARPARRRRPRGPAARARADARRLARGRQRADGRRARLADHGGAQDAALPAHPSLVPGDRRARLRIGEHGQDAGQRRLPQARCVVPLRGRLARAPARAARRLAP